MTIKLQLDALYVMHKVTKTIESKDIYEKYKREYRAKVIQAKRSTIENFIVSSDNVTKATWKIIKKETQKQSSQDQSTISASELNTFFRGVAENITSSIPGPTQHVSVFINKIPTKSSSMFLTPVTATEIITITKNLKTKATTDIFGMSTKILKKVIDILATPLSALINRCFETGTFPDELKIAKVIPIHKTGKENVPDNYRPISILPTVSKIFETAIKDRLIKYLTTNEIIVKQQHAYMKGKSTITAMLDAVETIAEALDNKEEACMTCCDLSKAFDCVDHAILLQKMERYGIRGVLNKLIASYLKNRQQLVEWNGERSETGYMDRGVAQGSVLSAILFILYINDLPNNIPGATVNLFADDASFLQRSNSRNIICAKTEDAMARANEWFSSNNLCLNVNKTQNLLITTKEKDIAAPLKFLGLHFNQDLKWNDHVTVLSRRLSSAIYAIRRIRKISTLQAALTTYHAYFLSRAAYGILVWGASPDAHRIFLQQKEAVRAVTMSTYRAECRPIFKKYRLLTIPSIYIYHALSHVHSSKEQIYPTRQTIHNYPTRQRHKIDTPIHRLTRTQETARPTSIRLYNKLPESFTDISLVQFRRKIKEILINNAFYSIEEFLHHDF